MTSPALLVAPDHPDQDALRGLLQAAGHAVVACVDADEIAAAGPPALILLALDRDGARSAELCARLPCRELPVVVLVRDPGPADLLRLLGCGAAACLSDSLSPTALAAHVDAMADWTPDSPMRLDLAVDLHADRRQRVQDLIRWVSDADGDLDAGPFVQRLVEGDRRAALGRLSEAVAHDFNNLLTVVAGRARLVLDRYWGDDATKTQLEQLLQAAEAATALSRKLLAVGRPWDMGTRTVALTEFLREVRDVLDEAAPENVTVALGPVPDDARVVADPARLEQVLLNLGLNAVDAVGTAQGNVLLSASLPGSDGHLVVQVQDSGVGMTEEVLERASDPFFSTRGRSGLGLATVCEVVAGLGGTLVLDSEPGRGTTASVRLPVADEAEDDPASAAPTGTGPARVVVCEDEEGVRTLVATVLRREGFTVVEACSAEQAVAQAGDPDLLITDLTLEGMSGPDLARTLRASHPGMRVLFISGHTGNVVTGGGIDLDGPEFLQKPFTPDLLVDRVRRLLHRA